MAHINKVKKIIEEVIYRPDLVQVTYETEIDPDTKKVLTYAILDFVEGLAGSTMMGLLDQLIKQIWTDLSPNDRFEMNDIMVAPCTEYREPISKFVIDLNNVAEEAELDTQLHALNEFFIGDFVMFKCRSVVLRIN